MTVSSRIIQTFIQWSPDAVEVPLINGLSIQIVPTMNDLAQARKHQYAAFVASEKLLVVWDDEAMNIIPRAKAIEKELMELVWKSGITIEDENHQKRSLAVLHSESNEEAGEYASKRSTKILNAVLVSATLVLVTGMLGAGFRQVTIGILIDKGWARLAFLGLTPVQVFFTLVSIRLSRGKLADYSCGQFFIQVIVGCIAQCIGPIKQMTENSRYYSVLPPYRIQGRNLPHVTIQCPVYKEGLGSVIVPTIKSIKQAISTYELQGGSANIFVNDDGLQLISDEEREARIEFYADHCIGWTARPRHNENGFSRRGKFKKASNMNYGLMLSNKIEEKMDQVIRQHGWNQKDEAEEYERRLREVLQENGRAWMDGNIRIGDYILLSMSLTKVMILVC